jgi:GT2 family glycosyltransferase
MRLAALPSSLQNALFPRFAMTGAAEARVLQAQAVNIVNCLMTPVLIVSILAMRPFLTVWIGRTIAAAAAPVGQILILGLWPNMLAFVPFGFLQSRGRPDLPAKFHVAELFFYAPALYFLTRFLGVGCADLGGCHIAVRGGAPAAGPAGRLVWIFATRRRFCLGSNGRRFAGAVWHRQRTFERGQPAMGVARIAAGFKAPTCATCFAAPSARGADMKTVIVTVTYGKRLHLLTQVLDAARAEGAAAALVVDNGSADPVRDCVAGRYGGWAEVLGMGGNAGSASGFKAGIEQARAGGAAYILLLDDDNVLCPGSLKKLQEAFAVQRCETAHPALAVFGFRRDRHQRLVEQACNHTALRVSSTFRGFHLFDIGSKIRRRVLPAPASAVLPAAMAAQFAPYGGLFFHQTLIEHIGLPRTDFVLYEDDTEFTSRLVRTGGRLLLVPDAEIIDLETSWNQLSKSKTSFSVWLDGASDFRAFYAFRNGVFSDLYCRGGSRIVIAANMISYMVILTAIAVVKRRFGRLALLFGALCAGVAGRLGMCRRLPLTQINGRSAVDA